tara:strand:- start:548 stop:784 length:237 start_codon:yes stop_codon:yes gene_type:complete
MTNNFEDAVAMEEIRKFALTKEQYQSWEQFITDNYKTIYSNKDMHEAYHTPNSPYYIVSVFKNEQSGMQDFLETLIVT